MRRTNYPDYEVTRINWQVFRSLIPYLMEFKSRIAFALSCLILTKLASVYLPFVLKDLVDTLDTNLENKLVFLPLSLIVSYGLVRFSIVIFAEIRDTLFGRVTERAIRRIGLNVFKHLHSLDVAFHLNRQTGGISRDIDRGTSGINFLMRFMVFNIVPTFLELLLVVGILWYNYGWLFAGLTLVSVVLYVSFSVKATEWRTGYIREANKADSASNTRAIDSLLNYETVKYFTNESYEAKQYDEHLAKWEKAKAKNRLSLFALNSGQAFIIALSMTTMLGLAAHQVSQGNMTIGDFVLINAFMMQLFLPLNFLGFVYREIKGSLANIEQMFGLLNQEPAIKDSSSAISINNHEGSIEFKDVSFDYGNERTVLSNVNFKIKAGQKVAIVGESGSGKSTIAKLILRFYDVTGGQVLLDNTDIRKVTQYSLRSAIGVVPQDTVLFNDSIFENVRYGNPESSDEQVYQAIAHAHLKDFIEGLPEQYETKVGERGLKLSGGEKQRVAIARAILKAPKVLLFDEATSSLDSHSEQAILSAINEVSIGHTSIAIAHRLSTIVDADLILVMNKGELVEQGSHQQLIQLNGYYNNMWQLQLSESGDVNE